LGEETKHPHLDDEIMSSINRVIAGDTESFWRLVEPYQQNLRVAAYSLLRNSADAEEVVQEALLKALKHLQQLKEGHSFKSWLMRIAVNEARMRIRKSREEVGYDEWTDEDLKVYAPRDRTNWQDIPSNALEQKEIWEAVQRALQTLSPRCREIFVLRDIQHFSLAEAARILGISEAMASVRLHRARLHLREMLAPLFREPPSPWIPFQMMVDMPVMMMHRVIRCKHVLREISKYIDGELDPVVRAQVEEHLKYCRRCKVLLDTTRRLLYLLADGKVFVPPFPWQAAGNPEAMLDSS
jgi:RNA polymerase sigma-70 factor (ECF subfamily)